MADPSRHLLKLSQQLFEAESDRAAFIAALQQPPRFSPAILWTRPRPDALDWTPLPLLPWQPAFVDRLAPEARPGAHPLHGAGYFYCLDFSSVFAIAVIQAIQEPVKTAIDLCAAPGGKSLFTWLSHQPRWLLCNEVVRKRIKILIANLKRCGAHNSIILNLDPAQLADKTPDSADLVVVDAPCSGQSLLAKGQKAPGCFHPVTLNRNAKRQKRILANAAQLVAPGGYLAYMTCTYAPDENERVCTWLLKRFDQFRAVPVPALAPYQSPLTPDPCYRLWPQSGLGAGAFTMLLRRFSDGSAAPLNQRFLEAQQFVLHPPHSIEASAIF